MTRNSTNQPDKRLRAATVWAGQVLGNPGIELREVSGDASFRRYYRFDHGGRSIILMDAPPEKEDSSPFIDIAERLRTAGLYAPEILHFDLHNGFGLLEDLGDTLYRELIDDESVDELFPGLFTILEGFARDVDSTGLPVYDEAWLQSEMELFPDWYLARHKKRPFDDHEMKIWEQACRTILSTVSLQPQVFVHHDFHSCNLLQTRHGAAIIDFQDGVLGPLSYDFASLAWDRYISWPRERLLAWMEEMHQRYQLECPLQDWVRTCDFMGLQRNLKIVGIFARLHYRDGKNGYVEMIPRFYGYLLDVLPLYPEFSEFQQLLEQAECAP